MTTKATYRKTFKQKLPFCLLMLCLMVMTACGNLYTGEETLFNPGLDGSIQEESVPVMVAFDDPYYNILSRGVGKIDPEDEWFDDKLNPKDENGAPIKEEKPAFYVYAFRKHMGPYGYNITRELDPDICLVDGSTGTQAEEAKNLQNSNLAIHGKWAYYNGNGSFANWFYEDEKLFYSNIEQSLSFDFFAYHIDDSEAGDIVRTDDYISFPVKIDGSQDLMWGKAELTKEQLATIAAIEDEEKKEQIERFYYSTYSGRYNIWPIFQMKHQMAYVSVRLIAGNAYGDPVKVHDVSLKTHTEGTFVVVSKDPNQTPGAHFDENSERVPLYLKEFNEDSKKAIDITPEVWEERYLNNEYRLEYYSEEEKLQNGGKERPDPYLAGELLIPPGNNVVLSMLLSNKDTENDPDPLEPITYPLDKVTTKMGDGSIVNGFIAGKTYHLNITVYGPKQISIDVEASPWKDGGDVDVDMEDDIIKNK